MKRYRNYIALCVAGICTLCTPLVSCNDDLEDGLRKDYPSPGYDNREGHVLWIVLNGASGSAVREANNDRRVENMSSMMSHALYTFNGLADTRSDTVVSNRMGRDNLFTGLLNRTSDTPDILSLLKKRAAVRRFWLQLRIFMIRMPVRPMILFGGRMNKSRLALWMNCLPGKQLLLLWLWNTMAYNWPVNSMVS